MWYTINSKTLKKAQDPEKGNAPWHKKTIACNGS